MGEGGLLPGTVHQHQQHHRDAEFVERTLIVMTDGRHNRGSEPRGVAEDLAKDGVQIHTAAYAGDALPSTRKRLLARLVDAAKIAVKLKLRVAAGAGLGYTTARAVGQLSEVETCIIGHSIMARALMVGIETAVREMIILLEGQ